jgi:hypothetical protein
LHFSDLSQWGGSIPATEYEAAVERVIKDILTHEAVVYNLAFDFAKEIADKIDDFFEKGFSPGLVDVEIDLFIRRRSKENAGQLKLSREALFAALITEGLLNKYKPGRANE